MEDRRRDVAGIVSRRGGAGLKFWESYKQKTGTKVQRYGA